MDAQFPSFAILSSFLLFIFMISKLCKRNKSFPLPPGPWKLPLIGNIFQLLGPPPHRRLRDLAKLYGSVMSISLGQLSVVVISSPDAAKQVLKTLDPTFADRPVSLATKTLLYNGNDLVFGSYGDQWRQLKKICIVELLSARRVQSFESVRGEQVSKFIGEIGSKGGRPVNLTQMLLDLATSVMVRVAVRENCRNREALIRAIDGIFEAQGGFGVADVFPSLRVLHVITGLERKLLALHKETDQILTDIIREHKSRSKDGREPEHENLLDVLLDLQKNGYLRVPLTDDNVKGTILDMFAAGSDTTSKTVEWAMSELVQNSRLMKKAQKEVRRVFSRKGQVDEKGLQELKFLKCVIKETLRLHPPIPLAVRECREMTNLNGFAIYPNTKVMINLWAIGRDLEAWEDAEKFNPKRFVDRSIDYKGNNMELVPFGGGKRICPGMMLGVTSVELFLANLLYHFDWKIVDGEEFELVEAYAGSLKRKNDLKLIPIHFRS